MLQTTVDGNFLLVEIGQVGWSQILSNNPPTDPPKSVSRGLNLPPTVTSLKFGGFMVGLVSLGRWVNLAGGLNKPSPE